MTEGFGAFRDAISNLEAAAGGGGAGMVRAEDGSMVPASFYDDGPALEYQDKFLGKQGFAWDAEGNPVDAIDETDQAAYWADNRSGVGAVPYEDSPYADDYYYD